MCTLNVSAPVRDNQIFITHTRAVKLVGTISGCVCVCLRSCAIVVRGDKGVKVWIVCMPQPRESTSSHDYHRRELSIVHAALQSQKSVTYFTNL